MASDPKVWVTGELITAEDLNRLEQAIDAADTALEGKADSEDQRFSDARPPTAHAASHRSDGADALSPADIGAVAAGTPVAASRATGASAGTVTVTKQGVLVVADLAGVVCTGTSELAAALPSGTAPPRKSGHGFVEDSRGEWWPVRVTTTHIEILGPPPAGTTVEGSLWWRV